jgi:hypothetical protein
MGLDMYLKGKRYLSSYNDQDKPVKNAVNKAVFGEDFELDTSVDSDRQIVINQVEAEVAYWRKANAIHQWFVDNVQEGVDECQESYVTREQLQELLDICNQVLANKKKAAELLPPQAGFFFGSTIIDDWYMNDVQFTADRLTELLTDEKWKHWDFYYQASW